MNRCVYIKNVLKHRISINFYIYENFVFTYLMLDINYDKIMLKT